MGFRSSSYSFRLPVTNIQQRLTIRKALHHIVLIISTGLLGRICIQSQPIDNDLLHVHATLYAFARRGQMSIEVDLPLLSTLISPEGNAILEVGLCAAWLGVGYAVLRRWSAVVGFGIWLAWGWRVEGGLDLSWSFGDVAVCLGLLVEGKGVLGIWCEGLVLVGFAFGWSESEVCIAYLLLLARRMGGLFRTIANTKISWVCGYQINGFIEFHSLTRRS